MHKRHLALSTQERKELLGLLQSGRLSARVYQRIQVLLHLDAGKSYRCVSTDLSLGYTTVRSLSQKYQQRGLGCIYDLPRSGRPIEISGSARAKITALACSTVGSGRAAWTLRLLSEKAVELGLVEQISHTQVRNILKKRTASSLKKDLVYGKL